MPRPAPVRTLLVVLLTAACTEHRETPRAAVLMSTRELKAIPFLRDHDFAQNTLFDDRELLEYASTDSVFAKRLRIRAQVSDDSSQLTAITLGFDPALLTSAHRESTLRLVADFLTALTPRADSAPARAIAALLRDTSLASAVRPEDEGVICDSHDRRDWAKQAALAIAGVCPDNQHDWSDSRFWTTTTKQGSETAVVVQLSAPGSVMPMLGPTTWIQYPQPPLLGATPAMFESSRLHVELEIRHRDAREVGAAVYEGTGFVGCAGACLRLELDSAGRTVRAIRSVSLATPDGSTVEWRTWMAMAAVSQLLQPEVLSASNAAPLKSKLQAFLNGPAQSLVADTGPISLRFDFPEPSVLRITLAARGTLGTAEVSVPTTRVSDGPPTSTSD